MPNQRTRIIRLRWRSRCSVCGHQLPAGDQVRWDAYARTATCLTCSSWTPSSSTAMLESAAGGRNQPPPMVLGVAGGSALREYERRRAARERRARERAGTLGVLLARLTGDPVATRNWRKGGEGEARVAQRLARLLDDSDVHVLHDRLLPGRTRANIDHIAVGPGGVTVIDAKTLSGKVRVESVSGPFGARRQLRVGGRDRTRLVYGVLGQAEAVRTLLERHRVACEVRCALCFADPGGLPLLRRLQVEEVTIDGPRRVAKLASRPGPNSPEQIARIVGLLAVDLRSA